jgi:hypothetical protein
MDLTVGHVDNKSMSLFISVDDQILYNANQTQENKLNFKFSIGTAQNLLIKVDGKKINDTKIDPQGNILQDKFVRVDRLTVNSYPLAKWMLESKVFQFIDSQGNISNSNYFGKNGQTTVNFGGDLLKYFLLLNCKAS